METARGGTRGKFTELVFDVKHDAWVIPQLSHGILLIVDAEENTGTPALKVENVDNTPVVAAITSITVTPETIDMKTGDTYTPSVTIVGTGAYDKGWTATSGTPAVASIDGNGMITALSKGTATITYKAVGNQAKTDTVTVNVDGGAD